MRLMDFSVFRKGSPFFFFFQGSIDRARRCGRAGLRVGPRAALFTTLPWRPDLARPFYKLFGRAGPQLQEGRTFKKALHRTGVVRRPAPCQFVFFRSGPLPVPGICVSMAGPCTPALSQLPGGVYGLDCVLTGSTRKLAVHRRWARVAGDVVAVEIRIFISERL